MPSYMEARLRKKEEEKALRKMMAVPPPPLPAPVYYFPRPVQNSFPQYQYPFYH